MNRKDREASTEQKRTVVDDPEELLSQDHQELDQLLEAVQISLKNPIPAEILPRLDLFWARLAMHIRAEHLHLFPSIANELEKASHNEET